MGFSEPLGPMRNPVTMREVRAHLPTLAAELDRECGPGCELDDRVTVYLSDSEMNAVHAAANRPLSSGQQSLFAEPVRRR